MSDQDDAFRRIWQTFRTYRRVADGRHDTPEWRDHSGPFAVCCIRVPAEVLQPSLAEVQNALQSYPFVRVHPDGFLHIMLQELGFLADVPKKKDEIARTRLDEFVQTAQVLSEFDPFPIAIGGINAFQDAVFLDVHDRSRCNRIHTRLREIASVTSLPRFAYLPHTTIAHFTADVPIGNLPAVFAQWRDRRFGRFLATEVEIATLAVNEAYPPLQNYATIPLTG